MGYVDPIRLGIVAAVMLTAWHAVWMALVAAGVAQRVAEFLDLHPDVRVELILTNEELDLAMREADAASVFEVIAAGPEER